MLFTIHQLGISSIIFTTVSSHQQWIQTPIPGSSISKFLREPFSAILSYSAAIEGQIGEQEPKVKWTDVPIANLTEEQHRKVSQISPKISKRCKALMKRLICYSPQNDELDLVLASWARAMKPNRADWLSVIRELKRLENPLLLQVMDCVLLEDSFDANLRDYTKLIHAYAKSNLLHNAENIFQAMKDKGFVCDQITLTVLVDMYSKAGDLNLAKEAFEEIKLLGLPLDKRAYGSMIMAYIRAGKLELAESLILEMESQEIQAGKEVYKAMLRAYSLIGDSEGAQRIFDAIQFAGLVPDSKLCALLVNAYIEAEKLDDARIVVVNMRNVGIKPNDKCIALMLKAYEKLNNLQEALGFLMDLEEEGILVEQESSEVLAGWFGRLGVVSEVEQVLRELSGNKDEQSAMKNTIICQHKRSPLSRYSFLKA